MEGLVKLGDVWAFGARLEENNISDFKKLLFCITLFIESCQIIDASKLVHPNKSCL